MSIAVREARPWTTEMTARFGMALFIAAEAMFFAGLISAYLVFRAGNPDWPPAGQPRMPVVSTAFNTLILFLSAVWVQLCAQSVRRGRREPAKYFLGAALVFGLFFLILQGREWIRLVQFGLTVTSSIYGALFYTLIGAHGIHVLGGVAFLLFALKCCVDGRCIDKARLVLELARMFWNFVVGLWPVLYVLVYLL